MEFLAFWRVVKELTVVVQGLESDVGDALSRVGGVGGGGSVGEVVRVGEGR